MTALVSNLSEEETFGSKVSLSYLVVNVSVDSVLLSKSPTTSLGTHFLVVFGFRVIPEKKKKPAVNSSPTDHDE